MVGPESPPDDLPKSIGGGGGPGGGGAGAPPLGAPPEAEATGPCKTKMLKYLGNSFIDQVGTQERDSQSCSSSVQSCGAA